MPDDEMAMKLVGSIGLFGVALFFVGMGFVAFLRPRFVVGLFGGRVETAASRTEVRAVYGGFGVATGLALAWTGLAPPNRLLDGVVLGGVVSLGGMACGRVVGAIVGRETRLFPTWAFVGIELVLAGGLGLWLAARGAV